MVIYAEEGWGHSCFCRDQRSAYYVHEHPVIPNVLDIKRGRTSVVRPRSCSTLYAIRAFANAVREDRARRAGRRPRG